MSLILDALRKSEAERRRGEKPSLYSSLPVPGTRRRPSALRYLPWIVVAVLVVVALFAFRKQDSAPATKEELTQPSGAGKDDTPESRDTGFETAAAVVAASPAPPPPPPASAAASKPTLPPAPTVDALVKTPAPAPAPNTAAAVPAAPFAAATAPAPPTASDAGSDEPLPPVAVLDTSTRGTLPALKLSMHFYSADPERRFAIIDGQRVVEGSQLGAGVVTQIRRDGVVIEVAGRRVLVPRP